MNDVPVSHDATHLLIIGNTKTGKSTYSAQAVLDGWPMIYIDADNGLSALRRSLKGNVEAMKRVHYFRTEKPSAFLKALLQNAVFRWNTTQDCEYASFSAKPTDEIADMRPARIPREVILNVDSWTAVSLDAMDIGAENKKTELEKMVADNKAQGVYQDAGLNLSIVLSVLQQTKFHVIVQAHPGVFEKLEKPAGKRLSDIKQGDMIIKDTIDIPLSCSKPHGHTMGKFFTDIAWLELDRMEDTIISFKRRYGRISGGTLDVEGLVSEYSFSKTFGKPSAPYDFENESRWIRYITHAEFAASVQVAKDSQPKPAGAPVPGVITAKPANAMAAMIAKGK